MSGHEFKRMCQLLKIYPVSEPSKIDVKFVGGRFGGDPRKGHGILQHEEKKPKGIAWFSNSIQLECC